MAITVEERIDSREVSIGDQPTAILRYVVRGTADDYDAWEALGAEASATWHGLVRTSHEVRPIHVETGSPSRCVWEGIVRYGRRRRQPDTNNDVFEFDTGGGTQHVTQSLATVASYAPGEETAPDFKGAIGVTQNTIEGVDITVPVYNFSETHYLPAAYITDSYKRGLLLLTGKVNNASFRGFAAGEVLFLGAAGSLRSASDWEIGFRFGASLNRANFTVGDITGIDKKGWEYMWVRYDEAESEGVTVKRPVAVYIERVYDYADFSRLAIGV